MDLLSACVVVGCLCGVFELLESCQVVAQGHLLSVLEVGHDGSVVIVAHEWECFPVLCDAPCLCFGVVCEQCYAAGGVGDFIALACGFYGVGLSVGAFYVVYSCAFYGIVAAPEFYGVEHECIDREAYGAYDGLQNESHYAVHDFAVGHGALPFGVVVEEVERTYTRAHGEACSEECTCECRFVCSHVGAVCLWFMVLFVCYLLFFLWLCVSAVFGVWFVLRLALWVLF